MTLPALRLAEYFCRCGWHAEVCSYTDASQEVWNPRTGRIELDRLHVPICPSCYAVLPPRGVRAPVATSG